LSLIATSKIEPNPWNPNVMGEKEYLALKEDMRVHGAEGIDPVLVSPKGIFFHDQPLYLERKADLYVIVDGEHRWRAARELKWEAISCDVKNIKEDEAKALCYARNRERGTIDPFKEAALFKTEQGTQAEVAQKYGVDPTTVSHRLSLLKLAPTVTKAVQDMPRGKLLTVSHLEPLATLPEGDQVTVLKQVKEDMQWREGPPSVKSVQEKVETVKREREEERQLQEALKTAKFPKCPTCGKPPKEIQHKGLSWVECESGRYDHTWNLDTGKLLFTPTRSTPAGEGKTERPLPQTLRSNYTTQEIHAALVTAIKEVVPRMEIAEIRVSGRLDKAHFSFDLNSYSHAMSVSVEHGRQNEGFRAEEHEYRTGEKTTVHCGTPQYIERTKRFIEKVFKGEMLKEKEERE